MSGSVPLQLQALLQHLGVGSQHQAAPVAPPPPPPDGGRRLAAYQRRRKRRLTQTSGSFSARTGDAHITSASL